MLTWKQKQCILKLFPRKQKRFRFGLQPGESIHKGVSKMFSGFQQHLQHLRQHLQHTQYYEIQQEQCVRCGSCMRACQHKAIRKDQEGRYRISKSFCHACGACQRVCPRQTIQYHSKQA